MGIGQSFAFIGLVGCIVLQAIFYALNSQANKAIAQELDARTLLLQPQMDYTQANDVIIHAVGRTPE